MTLPVWLQAGFWGSVAGSALLIGAAIGYFARVPQRWIAAVMAFGGGVLISALQNTHDGHQRSTHVSLPGRA
jgi:zinc transporter, ZIP family